MNGQTTPARRRILLRAVSATLLGLLLGAGALELGLRFLLFSPSSIARKLGADLRKAGRFGDHQSEDEYWKLQDLFLDPAHRVACPNPDPVCGWTGGINPGTYAPVQPVDLRGRRPILLYGDSFAVCATPPGQCFQTLLEQSDLADRYCLINYGVGGYGVDQEYLLFKHSIDQWKDLDPIVVVSFLIDDDFSRNVLTFRCWPKPHLRIDGDRLVADGPVTLDPEEFREKNPIGIRSYLWRFLVFSKGILPSRVQRWLRGAFSHRTEELALAQKLLEEFHRELESRGLRHFFLNFVGWGAFLPGPQDRWAEQRVEETAARLGVPVISTRPFLLGAADGVPTLVQTRLFLEPTYGHYNEFGNIAAFEALRQGIEGRFDATDVSRVAGLLRSPVNEDLERRTDTRLFGRAARIRTLGRSGFARLGRVPYPPFSRGEKGEKDETGETGSKEDYLLLGPGDEGPTEVRVAVPERACRFRGRAISVARGPSLERRNPLILTIRVDGRSFRREEVPFWPDGIDLEIPLEGAKQLELAVDRTGPSAGSEWIHIARARLEWNP